MKQKLYLITILISISCTNNFHKTNKIYKSKIKNLTQELSKPLYIKNYNNEIINKNWIGTVNFNLRKPNFVIIHHTAQNSCEKTLNTFISENKQVSAHYVICKDGTVFNILNDYLRAWHAGKSSWGSISDLNSISIGIELDNNGIEPFDSLQISCLINLLKSLKEKYNIPSENFIGHSDVAPNRKKDPNIYFPWKKLASEGIGVWFEPDSNLIYKYNLPIPLALSMIGYDISDTNAAIIAFKRHFRNDSTNYINKEDESVIFQIINNKIKKK